MTKTLIHHSPAGDLSIVGISNSVPPGTPFDVDDELAEQLLEQADLFAEVIEGVRLESLPARELRKLAIEAGIDVPAKASKPQLLELIDAADLPVIGDPTFDSPAAPAADQQGDLA